MEQAQLTAAVDWFNGYVATYYGDDLYSNMNIRYKEIHCRSTCGQMFYLARHLKLAPEYVRLAKFIGLFHDIGRFEQFRRYGTYKDGESVDHGELGHEVLQAWDKFRCLDRLEQQIIMTAVRCHCQRVLPKDLPQPTLFYTALIRDADKLDIFRIVRKNYERYAEDPHRFDLGVSLPDEPVCHPEVVEAVLAGRQVPFDKLVTLDDLRLMQVGWVYDLRFKVSLKRVRERRYVEQILAWVSDVALRKQLLGCLLGEIDRRLQEWPEAGLHSMIGV